MDDKEKGKGKGELSSKPSKVVITLMSRNHRSVEKCLGFIQSDLTLSSGR